MFRSPPTAPDPSADDELRSEVVRLGTEFAALNRRLANVEALLLTMFGPNALGGGPRPTPEPEAELPRLKPIADLPGSNGALVTVSR
jgi:hypothetical protein